MDKLKDALERLDFSAFTGTTCSLTAEEAKILREHVTFLEKVIEEVASVAEVPTSAAAVPTSAAAVPTSAAYGWAKLFDCPSCGSGINTRHGNGTRTCGKCGASFKVEGH